MHVAVLTRSQAVQQLNLVRRFMGINNGNPFNRWDAKGVNSNSRGLSQKGATAAETAVQRDVLYPYLKKPQEDLQKLLTHFGLDEHMHGLNLWLKTPVNSTA